MSAAAELGAGERRVHARARAHTDLPRAVLRFLHRHGAVRALDHAAEGGEVFHVGLGERHALLQGLRHSDDNNAVFVVEFHRAQKLSFKREALFALRAEVELVDGFIVDARLHQRGGHAVRVRRDVGVDKAARVGRNGDIERQGDFLRQLPQLLRKRAENFAAGGALGVHAALGRVVLVARVMVDGEIDARFEHLGVVREEAQRRKVDGNDRLIVKIVRHPVPLNIGGKMLGRLAVVENARMLSHRPQHGAQRRRAAEGVAVGAAVGEDEVLIVRAEVCRDFGNGHSCSSSVFSVSFSGFAGFTTCGSRSISRMCAPYSMESSAMN